MTSTVQVAFIRFLPAQDALPLQLHPAVIFQPQVSDRTPGRFIYHWWWTWCHRVIEHCTHYKTGRSFANKVPVAQILEAFLADKTRLNLAVISSQKPGHFGQSIDNHSTHPCDTYYTRMYTHTHTPNTPEYPSKENRLYLDHSPRHHLDHSPRQEG